MRTTFTLKEVEAMLRRRNIIAEQLRTEGNCRDSDVDFFDPRARAFQEATCSRCSIIETCANYAIQFESEGYWGGMTERQRGLARTRLNIKFIDLNEVTLKVRAQYEQQQQRCREEETRNEKENVLA